MEKEARKKSDDPLQEALRTHKDKWNSAVKEFISRVIAFKRALNGRGDAAYSLPPSNIKNPLPSEVGAFLREISSNFEQLAAEALRIEQEQEHYSSNRKQPAPKTASFFNKLATLQEKKINIGAHVMPTLLAVSAEEQERGLMHREWPPPIMSFVYNTPRINKFWMHQTPSPLDIVFALDGEITSIHKGEPNSTSMIGDNEFSDLVVELPYGTCQKLAIKIGDKINLI